MTRISGHFGEILQGRLGPEGQSCWSCPAPVLGAEAWVEPSASLSLWGSPAVGRGRLVALLRGLGLPLRGRFVLRVQMPPGGGAGASTAGLLALARAVGARPSPGLMALIRGIEGASIFVLPQAAGLGLSPGQVLGHLRPCRAFQVLGGFWGSGQRADAGTRGLPM